jgi:hypothetical protein
MLKVLVAKRFGGDLHDLIPNSQERQDFIDGATLSLSASPDGSRIDGTDVYTKMIPDIPNGRLLVIFFTKDEKNLTMESIRETSIH